MKIEIHNNKIEISELGLKLEIQADLLLNKLISDKTKEILPKIIDKWLNNLLSHFEEIHKKVESENKEFKSEYYESLKEERNEHIFEYASLMRDLYMLVGDTFENFCYRNSNVMATIDSIYIYSVLYGFSLPKNYM